MQDCVVRLFHAGYSELFRENVVKQSITRYDGMVEADRNGSHPLYRQRDWEEQERRDHKAKKKMNWITRGGFDTVIRVNPTPGGELAKQLQKVLDANPGPVKVKIQELGGTKVKNLLQKPNLTKTRSCDSKDCLACKNGRGEGGTAGEIMLAMF